MTAMPGGENERPRARPISQVVVSLREAMTVEMFIDYFLKSHFFAVTDDNRRNLSERMTRFQMSEPIHANDLTAWLAKDILTTGIKPTVN